jgi:hypothetical protein
MHPGTLVAKQGHTRVALFLISSGATPPSPHASPSHPHTLSSNRVPSPDPLLTLSCPSPVPLLTLPTRTLPDPPHLLHPTRCAPPFDHHPPKMCRRAPRRRIILVSLPHISMRPVETQASPRELVTSIGAL